MFLRFFFLANVAYNVHETERARTLLGGLWGDGELFALLHGNLLARDLIVYSGQILLRQVLAVINTAIHLDVLLLRHLVLHLDV